MAGLVEGKVALVTGAGSGIGRESARLFAAEGATVLVTDVDETGGTETVDLITGGGGEASFLRVDVTSEADVENMVAAAVERFGGLHCAHNNAGISDPPVDFTDMTLESWNRMIAIQLTGTFLCMNTSCVTSSPMAAGRSATPRRERRSCRLPDRSTTRRPSTACSGSHARAQATMRGEACE